MVFLFLIPIGLFSQTPDVFEKTYANIQRAQTSVSPIAIIGSSSKNAYIMYISGIGKKTIKVVSSHTKLSYEYKILKVKKEKRWPYLAFLSNEKLYMVYMANHKKASKLIFYVHEINEQNLVPNANGKKMFEFTYANYFEEMAVSNGLRISNANNKCITFWFSTPQVTPGPFYVQPTGVYTMHFYFCNSQLDLTRSTLLDWSASSEFRQEIVTPSGSLLFLIQNRLNDTTDGIQSPFKILKFDLLGNQKTEKFGIIDQDIIDAKLVVNKSGELIVAGYCEGESNSKFYNVFSAKLDTISLELNNVKVLPINLRNDSDASKNNQMNYYLKDILYDKAGNLFITGEEYKEDIWTSYAPVTDRYRLGNVTISKTTMEQTGEEYKYTYGNILVTCIYPNKFECQSTRISKIQQVSPMFVPFASFITKAQAENGIAILYNGIIGGDYSRDETYINDKNKRNEIIYKMININSDCEKSDSYYLRGMNACLAKEIPDNYSCKDRLQLNNYLYLPEGSCILINSEAGNLKQFYIWK